jgi:hypothetical protein
MFIPLKRDYDQFFSIVCFCQRSITKAIITFPMAHNGIRGFIFTTFIMCDAESKAVPYSY